MIAKTLEELQIYLQALGSADAISALVVRVGFRNDLKLRDQIRESSGKIPAQIAEGFSQKTDRHFAHLYIARGAVNETRAHLTVACGRHYITSEELESVGGR